MFNHFPLFIYEQFHHKKMPVLLGESTDVGERAWRNRSAQKWQPTLEEEKAILQIAEERFIARLREEGLTEDECQEIISAIPSRQIGVASFTADLIYFHSHVPNWSSYKPAIETAVAFDQHCNAFAIAKARFDIEAFRSAGLAALDWLLDGLEPSDNGLESAHRLQARLVAADSWSDLEELAAAVAESMIFNVLSRWDILFCHYYFEGQAPAYPLFELMMPRLSPSIKIDPETGALSRNGKQPKRAIFEPAVHRLLDFVALLMFRIEMGCFPVRPVSVKQMGFYFKEDAQRLAKWRDEELHLSGKQFERLWRTGTSRYPKRKDAAVPLPLLLMAYLWRPLLARKQGELPSIVNCMDGYKDWWQRNFIRMQAQGLTFGTEPWPAWLTNQSSTGDSFVSKRSSQSSGRPSSPRESQ